MASKKPPPEPRFDEKGRKYCNAKNNTCNAWAMKDREKCYHHGGATPRGQASANFKTGAYSKYFKLPALKEIYDELVNDDTIDLFSPTADMLMLMARQRYLLKTGESSELWKEACKLWEVVRTGLIKGATAGQQKAMLAAAPKLHFLMTEGTLQSDRQGELQRITKQLDEMRDKAFKRALDSEYLIRTDAALAFYAPLLYTLQSIIIEYGKENKVADAGIIHALNAQWEAITSGRGQKFITANSGNG